MKYSRRLLAGFVCLTLSDYFNAHVENRIRSVLSCGCTKLLCLGKGLSVS